MTHMRRAAVLVLALAAAACGTVESRDPRGDTRYVDFTERAERDRAEIDRQVKALNETDPVRRADRLQRLDAALSALFNAQSLAFDASAAGDAGAMFRAGKMLDSVEQSIGFAPSMR